MTDLTRIASPHPHLVQLLGSAEPGHALLNDKGGDAMRALQGVTHAVCSKRVTSMLKGLLCCAFKGAQSQMQG
jgi:hypothetical protein